jgi:hypothetical protein
MPYEDTPFAATRDLAVDLTAVTRSNERHHIQILRGVYDLLKDCRCLIELRKCSSRQEWNTLQCTRNGVRRIIIMVGNHDDASGPFLN